MGGAFTGGRAILCDGKDIVDALNKVFDKKPGNSDYDAAVAAKDAFNLPIQTGDPAHLLGAYMAAGVEVQSWPHWKLYLKDLANRDPGNITAIAQARYDGLSAGDSIHTDKHPPAGGDHKTHVTKDKPNKKITVDSPFTPDSSCL